MRITILTSIIVSQIGFAAAYIVFTSENLEAFIRKASTPVISCVKAFPDVWDVIVAVTNGETHIDVKYLILMQLLVFLPMSMIRDMAKLGGTALVADFFIMLGLIYLYYYDCFTLATEGISDIVAFNSKDWTLFIGTAIFTFEGIGLIIPIQETMKNPHKFPKVLGGVMVIITIIFVSMGALSYAAYGSHTRTVIILNLPQDDKFVNA
jgi:proton-coupled amino acid transporter